MSGMLVKYKDGIWIVLVNLCGWFYLYCGIECIYICDLFVEVFFDGCGNGLNY